MMHRPDTDPADIAASSGVRAAAHEGAPASSGDRPPLSSHSHFAILDGLRGTAACCVLMFHGLGGGAHPLFINGDLMVDLFFMLSGLVVAYSYEHRLLNGMPLRDFALRRFVRLYPMIFLGAVLASAIAIFDLYFRHNSPLAMDTGPLITAIVLSFAVIPFTFGNPTPEIFPTNTVLWSLFFEIVANVVYVLIVRHLSLWRLALLVFVSLVALAIGGFGGGGINNGWMAIPRVCAGFFGGVMLHHMMRASKTPRGSMGFGMASLILILVSLIPFNITGYMFAPIFLLFAAMILMTVNRRPGGREVRICMALGALSYPLYVLHRPLLSTWLSIVGHVAGEGLQIRLAAVAAAFIGCLLLSHAVVRWYETPARRRLVTAVQKRYPPNHLLK